MNRMAKRKFVGKMSTVFLTMKKELPQIRAAEKRANFDALEGVVHRKVSLRFIRSSGL